LRDYTIDAICGWLPIGAVGLLWKLRLTLRCLLLGEDLRLLLELFLFLHSHQGSVDSDEFGILLGNALCSHLFELL